MIKRKLNPTKLWDAVIHTCKVNNITKHIGKYLMPWLLIEDEELFK